MKITFVTVIALLLALAAGGGARAENEFDFFAGWSRTEPARVTAEYTDLFGAGGEDSRNVDFKDSFSGGIGWKRWPSDPSRSYVGFGLDLCGFAANGGGTRFTVLPLGVSLLLRYPFLRDSSRPYGALQPYLGLGIDKVFGHASADWDELQTDVGGYMWDWDDIGVHAASGLNWRISERAGLFVEYRYTQLWIHAGENVSDIFFWTGEEISAVLRTHHLRAGWSAFW